MSVSGPVFFDSAMRPYEPVGAVSCSALGSECLLYEAMGAVGLEREGRALFEHLRETVGSQCTVWGASLDRASGALSWELAFARERGGMTPARLTERVAPWLTIDAVEPYPLPWRMFSAAFGEEELRGRRPVGLTLWVDGAGHSYELKGSELTLAGTYRFLELLPEVDEVLRLLAHSVHMDRSVVRLSELIPPELLRVHNLGIATRRTCDALYFSRLDAAQFAYFLESHSWPAHLRDFFLRHREALGHLRWDVGFDFSVRDGHLEIRRSFLHGVT